MIHRHAAAAVLAALWALLVGTACSAAPTPTLQAGTCADPPIPVGVYESNIAADDDPTDFVSGTWVWHAGGADGNCLYDVVILQTHLDGSQGFVELHPYTINEQRQLLFHGMGEPLSAYLVTTTSSSFTLSGPAGGFCDDSGGPALCDTPPRALVFTRHPWMLVSPEKFSGP